MVRYNLLDDPLCYPGTQVLKNKAGITVQEDLEQFENLMFASRAEEELPYGVLDFQHYRAIHHHFFQDVFDWAGEIRTIRTGKGQNWFCYPEHIEAQANDLFAHLAVRNHFAEAGAKSRFAKNAAWFLSEINAIHPFREGNGRVQLVFLTLLARNAGYDLNEDMLQPAPFLAAMIRSFNGDTGPLAKQIEDML
ncbi:Fic family protein [Hoeflea sp. CAU 1731]